MPLEDVLLGFVAGAAGSFLMWLFIAPRMIVRYGQRALERWIDAAVPEDPEAAAAQHKPMDPRMKRLMTYASWHFSQVMNGVIGKLDQEVSEKLKNVDLGKLAPQLAGQIGNLGGLQGIMSMFGGGGANGKKAGGSWTDMLATLSMFSNASGGPQIAGGMPGGLPAGHPLLGR